MAPNYCNVLFPAQQLWVFSYNAWRVWRTPDKRSETIFFIQNLSRSFRFTAPWRCFFSSVHLTHLLQGSGQRTETAMVKLCFGSLSWWKIQTRPIIRFLTEAVRFWFFICWYLIESMMPCIWTRCSGPPAEKQAHNINDPAVYLTVDMGYFFLSLFVLNSSGGFAAKKLFFQFHLTIEASAIWSSSRVWQLNLLEFVFGWVRTIFLETLPNNMWWYRGCLIFLTLRLN